MAKLKNIQQAIVNRLAGSVSALHTKRVKPWAGTIEDFFDDGTRRYNLPFVGVQFVGSEADTNVVDNSVTEEVYTWNLMIIVSDLRGQPERNENALDLIDDIRAELIGHVLAGMPEVRPIQIGQISASEEAQELGVTAYDFEIYTGQIQQ